RRRENDLQRKRQGDAVHARVDGQGEHRRAGVPLRASPLRVSMPLSAEQVAQYHRDGYICPVLVMPAAEARGLRKHLEAYEATQGGHLQAVQRSRAFLLFKWLDDLIRDPRVLDPVEQLIGPDILCWSTSFWIKDAGSKSFVSW